MPNGKIIFDNNNMYINNTLTEIAKASKLNSNAFKLLYTSTDVNAIQTGVDLNITYAEIYALYATFHITTSNTMNTNVIASPRIAMLPQWQSYVYIGGSTFTGFGIRITDTYAVSFDMIGQPAKEIVLSYFTSTDKVKIQMSVESTSLTSASCSIYYIPWFA